MKVVRNAPVRLPSH